LAYGLMIWLLSPKTIFQYGRQNWIGDRYEQYWRQNWTNEKTRSIYNFKRSQRKFREQPKMRRLINPAKSIGLGLWFGYYHRKRYFNIIKHARKSLLFGNGKLWTKKDGSNSLFDVTIWVVSTALKFVSW
jgi:hypothetical protein